MSFESDQEMQTSKLWWKQHCPEVMKVIMALLEWGDRICTFFPFCVKVRFCGQFTIQIQVVHPWLEYILTEYCSIPTPEDKNQAMSAYTEGQVFVVFTGSDNRMITSPLIMFHWQAKENIMRRYSIKYVLDFMFLFT